jgi:FAD-dependent fumarate reductase
VILRNITYLTYMPATSLPQVLNMLFPLGKLLVMSRKRALLIASLSLFFAIASMFWRLLSAPIAVPKIIMSESSTAGGKKAIVIGAGLAGLSAASQLIEHNVPVVMLERFSKPGGNSIKASSGINGAPTRFQALSGFSDPDTSFYTDTVKSAGAVFELDKGRREDLIGVLTNGSKSAVEWLVDVKGIDLSVVSRLGGHSCARTHRGAGSTPPGASIVLTLLKSLQQSELFTLETECIVTRVLQDETENVVEGVEYECVAEEKGTERLKKTLYGPVIFATGGFAGDSAKEGMLATYRPDLVGFPSTNSARPGSQALLTAVGAQLIDMEQVQVHPTSFVDSSDVENPVKFLAAELLRGEGGVLLFNGERFVNEMETRKIVTDTIVALPTAKDSGGAKLKQWDIQLVLDEGVYENASSHVGFYIFKKLMHKTIISALPHPQAALKTLKTYSAAAKGSESDAYGRKTFGHWKLNEGEASMESVVYVGRVTPAIHFTMGGVVINGEGQVIQSGLEKPIGGLWAAGEVTGGVHGENRLGGSSLLECVVFGRRAGDGVAKHLRNKEEK